MTIPNKPFRASAGHTEFGTSGKISLAAASAGMATPFRIGDLAGKSNIPIYPFVRTITIKPGDGGNDYRVGPGSFLGRAMDIGIFSPNWIGTDGGHIYSASKDIGIKGKNVTNQNIKDLGLDPSQIIETSFSPYIAIEAEVDYDGYFGYYAFDVSNPFTGWVLSRHIDDHSGDGFSRYNFYYRLPVPADNQIILPAWYSDRGICDLTLSIVGYDETDNIIEIQASTRYDGYGTILDKYAGTLYINGIRGILDKVSADRNNVTLIVTFDSNPNVDTFIIKNMVGTKINTYSRRQVVVSTSEDWSGGYPPKITHTYADSPTEYVCTVSVAGIENQSNYVTGMCIVS